SAASLCAFSSSCRIKSSGGVSVLRISRISSVFFRAVPVLITGIGLLVECFDNYQFLNCNPAKEFIVRVGSSKLRITSTRRQLHYLRLADAGGRHTIANQ